MKITEIYRLKITTLRISIILFSLFSMNCLSYSLNKTIRSYPDPRKEFSAISDSGIDVFIGQHESNSSDENNGKLIFSKILNGWGREMVIHNGSNNNNLIMINEKLEIFRREIKNTSAYLIFETKPNIAKKIHKLFSELKISKRLNHQPERIIKEAGKLAGNNVIKVSNPMVICLLSIPFSSNTFSYDITCAAWKKTSNSYQLYSFKENHGHMKYDYSKHFYLSWRNRSYLVYTLLHAGFIFTLIGDIITLPIQFVYLLSNMNPANF